MITVLLIYNSEKNKITYPARLSLSKYKLLKFIIFFSLYIYIYIYIYNISWIEKENKFLESDYPKTRIHKRNFKI